MTQNPAQAKKSRFGVAGLMLLTLIGAEISFRLVGIAYKSSRRNAVSAENAFTILCVGDSFTFGSGAPPESSFPAQLQRALTDSGMNTAFSVVNEGLPAQNSSQLARKLPALLRRHKPNIVVVLTGHNDRNIQDSDYFLFLRDRSAQVLLRQALHYLEFLKTIKFLHVLFDQASYRITHRTAKPQPPATLSPEEQQLANKLERTDAGIQKINTFLAERPDNRFALEQKLGILFDLNRFDSALAAGEELIRRFPDYWPARLKCAKIYWILRRPDDAIDQWEKVLKIDPGNPEARARLYYKWHLRKPEQEMVLEKLQTHNLRLIHQIVLAHGARMVVMSYPHSDAERNPTREKVAADLGLLYVDNTRLFETLLQKDPPAKYFSGDEPEILASHCNAEGYRIIAENLFQHLQNSGWLPTEKQK